MEPVLVLALMTGRLNDRLRQAFPDAPTISDRTPPRLAATRSVTARLLHGLAARVDPGPA